MARTVCTVAIVCAAIAITVSAAADLKLTPQEFLIPRAAIKVDGDVGEWSLAERGYEINPERAGEDPAIVPLPSDPDNPLQGAADLSARVALAWDDENLYIAGEVTDDDLRGIKLGTAHNVGPPGWKCDSVMFQFHSFRKPLRSNSPYTDSPNVNLRYEVPDGGRGHLIDDERLLDRADAYWKLPEGSSCASRETEGGYQIEAAIPWSSLEYEPQAGDVLHCCFLLGDIDAGEKLNQLGWHFSGEPRERVVFRLLDRPEATGLMSLAASRPQAGSRWSVSYRVDARTADVHINQLALVGAEGPSATAPINEKVPQGQTATDVSVFYPLPGEPGEYEARLEVTIGGDTLVLCTEQFEVLPGPEPTPLIVNPPGEVHHIRPDRVAHSAYEDHRRGVIKHGFVNDRSGYEHYMLTHVADYLDKNMEPAIERSSTHMAEQVIKCYALYELSGDPKYADWVRRGLEVCIANLKKKPDYHEMFVLSEARYHIWLHDLQTDIAPPGIEHDFQELWAKVASEHDEGWMFSEWGYHNRCWHRLGVMKIARQFAEKLGRAVSPRVDEYIAWHQPKYDQFGAATDNSAGYHWVGFRYPVWWHMAFDTLDELAEHEGWVAALGRWRRYSSPSGAIPNFGDTSGWNTGAGSAMAYYELMSRLTRDGHFRWQAHRIAEYLYNHFWPRHDQYHGPRDFIATGFCRAWLFADDTVEPEPPQQSSLVTFRTRVVDPTDEDKASRPGWSGSKLVDEQVPDKLVLSSGNDPQRLWGLVELLDKGGHCGRLPGHIVGLIMNDAALLAGQGYYERSADFNNIMWIEDMEGLAADPRPMRAEVPRFVEDAGVTYARIRVARFEQMPVTYEREIVFVKNAFVLVKDRLTFDATMKVRVGPCWQTRDLGPQCGQDWFNCYYEWIYFTGLGLGKGVHSYRNPAWDLLVRFAPREDTRVTVLDRYEDNPYRTSGTQLRQSWAGIAQAGQVFTFTTILLPHPPSFDVTGYADWARFLLDNDDTTLVRVRTEFDDVHHFQEQHWVLLQEQAGTVEAEGFVGDARLAVVSRDTKGNLRPAVIVEGETVSLDGKDLAPNARRPEVQCIFEVEE